MYSIKLIIPPISEPLTLAETKRHLRVEEDFEDDDDLILSYIGAARSYFEEHDDRRLITQTWLVGLNSFRSPVTMPPLVSSPISFHSQTDIELPLRPLQVVNSIKYIDTDGDQITLDPSFYEVDAISFLPRIRPAFGETWPLTRCHMNAVEIECVFGYGDAVAVPDTLFDGTNYFLTITANWTTNIGVTDKTTAGFHIDFDTAAPAGAEIEILAQAGTPLQVLANETVAIDEFAVEADILFSSTLPAPSNIVGGIPKNLKQALLMLVGHFYENRESTADVTVQYVPMAYETLVGANRRVHV